MHDRARFWWPEAGRRSSFKCPIGRSDFCKSSCIHPFTAAQEKGLTTIFMAPCATPKRPACACVSRRPVPSPAFSRQNPDRPTPSRPCPDDAPGFHAAGALQSLNTAPWLTMTPGRPPPSWKPCQATRAAPMLLRLRRCPAGGTSQARRLKATARAVWTF